MKRLLNTQPEAIQYIEQAACIKGPRAVRVAFLYGFLQGLKPVEGRVKFNQALFARSYEFTRESVRNDLQLIEDMGWAEVSPHFSSTYLVLHGIPFEEMAAGLPRDDSEASMGCKPDFHGDDSEASMGMEGGLSTHKNSSNKSSNNSNKKTSSSPPSESYEDRIVKTWNENKSKTWKSIQVFGNRMETAKALAKQFGGMEKFIEYLPIALKEAAKDSWWGPKDMDWNKFMGTGNTKKAHFADMLDRGLSCQTSKPNNPMLILRKISRDHYGNYTDKTGKMSPQEFKEKIAEFESYHGPAINHFAID
ncbi:predicted protein [Cyanophage PSS2]|uniref:hypothetical protein n=1 Tax=Cyanophage PSS2 TaxID=658401 RepID=UPI0001B04042|nr:hypothetical protein PSS2_gp107 [Cyanophage PSS2]ACT65669.1 hypothetical protein [Cyanophage PSS2]ACY75809.1 predicted protein [Cyanophage PSS2]